jgi:hypothetical protein
VISQVFRATLATAAASIVLAAPAVAPAADEPSSKNYKSEFQSVRPPVSGLTVTVEGGDKYLVVKNGTGKTVLVPGYDGEQYLRFLPNGEVDVNLNSPAKYLNGIRFGTPDRVQIPRNALVGGKPKWQKAADNGTYRWFDHRIHWMDRKPPPIVKDQSKKTKIFDWKVPVSAGGVNAAMLGTLTWIPSGSSSSGLSGVAIAAIVAGVLALIVLIWLLLRRRRAPAAAESPRREKAAKEAW